MTDALTLRLAAAADTAAWDRQVAAWPDATLFHRLQFLHYHPAGRFDAKHLLLERAGKIAAVLPLAFRQGETGAKIAVSPYGASYGGFAGDISTADEWLPEAFVLLRDWLRGQKVTRYECTLPPHCYGGAAARQEFCLLQHGAKPVRQELLQYLDLTPEVNVLWDHTAVRCRQAVRKARKAELRLATNGDLGAAWDLVAANKQLHDNATPTHTRAELRQLGTLLPADVFADLAYAGAEPVATVVYFRVAPRAWCTFYIADLPAHRHNSPVSLLVWHGIERARAAGIRLFDFGTSSVNMEVREGVAFFKKSFGATLTTRPAWQWDLRE